VSWHRTIGRDTFWSPRHIVEQIAAIVAGLSCGWLVLHTTFAGSPEERAQSVDAPATTAGRQTSIPRRNSKPAGNVI